MKQVFSYMTGVAGLALLLGCAPSTEREDALIAVATNFVGAAAQIEAEFETATEYEVTLTTGATGQLYAQIRNGAPFDILLAADQARPEKLEQDGQGVAGSRFTYGMGQLALWSPVINPVSAETLTQGDFRNLAMANPDLAPYGRATQDVLDALGLLDRLTPKIVQGENIGQAYGLVATGNAELGFVAQSAVLSAKPTEKGFYWTVPQHLYRPIKQDAVLLTRAADNAAAKAFLNFLKSDEAKAVMAAYGYADGHIVP